MSKFWQVSALNILLLRAALRQGEAAILAWESWYSDIDFENLPQEALRLLPSVYQNLTASGFQQDLFPKLQGIYKKAWTRDKLVFSQILPVFQKLSVENFQLMLLGEACIAFGVYGQQWVRPLGHVTLGIAPNVLTQVETLLSQMQWQPHRPWYHRIRNPRERWFVRESMPTVHVVLQDFPANTQMSALEKGIPISALTPEAACAWLLKDRLSQRQTNRLVLCTDIYRLHKIVGGAPPRIEQLDALFQRIDQTE